MVDKVLLNKNALVDFLGDALSDYNFSSYYKNLLDSMGAKFYIDFDNGNDANSGIGSSVNAKKTLAGFASVWPSVTPGSTIFTTGTCYERLEVLANGSEMGDVTIDGQNSTTFMPSYSLNGSSFLQAGGIAYTSPWVLVSGTVYKKATNGIYPRYIMINGTRISPTKKGTVATPFFTQNEAWMVANLETMAYATNGAALYIKFPVGTTPASFDIRMSGEHILAENGVCVKNKTRVTFKNFTVKNVILGTQTGTRPEQTQGAMAILDSSFITISNVKVTDSYTGLYLSGGNNITVKDNCQFDRNEQYGIGIDGGGAGSTMATVSIIGGTTNNNGNEGFWDGTAWAMQGDFDGIGLGEYGGTITDLNIIGVEIKNNGPRYAVLPAYITAGTSTVNQGSGIFLGTSYAFSCNVNVEGCLFDGNNKQSLYLGAQFSGGRIAGNIITNTIYQSASTSSAVLIADKAIQVAPTLFCNNVLYNNGSAFGLNLAHSGSNAAQLKNNIFLTAVKGGTVAGQVDLFIDHARDNANVVESDNIFFRADSDNVIRLRNTALANQNFIPMSELNGNLAAYTSVYGSSNKLLNITVTNPNLNTTTLAPNAGSNAIGAGVKWWSTKAPALQNGTPLDSFINKGAFV
jgi:hypothetical protein